MRKPISPHALQAHPNGDAQEPQHALLSHFVALLIDSLSLFRRPENQLKHLLITHAAVQRPPPQTTTQRLRTLQLQHQRPDAFYRLYTAWDPEKADAFLLQHLLASLPADAPLVLAIDGTHLPRTVTQIPGVYWMPNPQGAVFDRGLIRGQRFETGMALVFSGHGYPQALPLRCVPAFSARAWCGYAWDRRSEVEAGLSVVQWVHRQCGALGFSRPLVVVADGAYDTKRFWQGLPAGVLACVRVNRQARLCRLPALGSRRLYSEEIVRPQSVWRSRWGWVRVALSKNGRTHRRWVRVVGPLRRVGWGASVFYLIVVRGRHRVGRAKEREPIGLLVRAVWDGSGWVLPYSVGQWLEWSWGRWEVERTHRHLKSDFGVGETQCWGAVNGVRSVQYGVWVYSLGVLSGYRAWGVCGGVRERCAWWGGSGRWSFRELWALLATGLQWVMDGVGVYTEWGLSGANWWERGCALRRAYEDWLCCRRC